MKKIIPVLLFIMAFTGFLASQILWDSYDLNAQQVDQDKQKHSVYEMNFQTLKFTTTKGSLVELKSEKSPIVILNFWASWCLPCLKEFPSLVKFQNKFQGKVKVFGINGDEEDPLENLNKVEKKYALNFESALDANSEISNKFMINTYPVSIVYHKGHVIYVNKKIHDFMNADFIKLIEDALKEN